MATIAYSLDLSNTVDSTGTVSLWNYTSTSIEDIVNYTYSTLVYGASGVSFSAQIASGYKGNITITACSTVYFIRVTVRPSSFGGDPASIGFLAGKWYISQSDTVSAYFHLPPGQYEITKVGLGHTGTGWSDPTYVEIDVVKLSPRGEEIIAKHNSTKYSHSIICTNCYGAKYFEAVSVSFAIQVPPPEGCRNYTFNFPPPPREEYNVSIGFGQWYPEFKFKFPSKPLLPGFETPEGIILAGGFIALWVALGRRMGFIHSGIVVSSLLAIYSITAGSYSVAIVAIAVFAFLLVYSYRTGKT